MTGRSEDFTVHSFDILCDGNLEWVFTSAGKPLSGSVKSLREVVGKIVIDGKSYIGGYRFGSLLAPYDLGIFICPYKSGEACFNECFQLVDKNF